MAIDRDFIEFVVDQIDDACEISYRLMFGGCTVYSKGKVIGLITDDRLFVKQTQAGRAFIGEVVEAPPYPGAKPAFLIGDEVEDRRWLTRLVELIEQDLPAPRPRKKKVGIKQKTGEAKKARSTRRRSAQKGESI